MMYVPSRQRSRILDKTAPTWIAAAAQYPGIRIRIVVDEDEVNDYERALCELQFDTVIEVMPDVRSGSIGAARQTILEHAAKHGYRYHLQVDDDMRVTPNLGQLIEVLKVEPRASGCAAWQSYYGLGMGKTTEESPDYERIYSSMGLQVKAYPTEPLLSLGGFDESLRLAEDVECIMKVARATGQYPLVHRRVVATSVNQRGAEGGCASRGGHSVQAESTVERLNALYGPGTASLRTHKKTGLPRDTIWMAAFWKDIDQRFPRADA